MRFLFQSACLLLLTLTFCATAQAENKADFSIYLFKLGRPLGHAQLFIDGKKFTTFSSRGSAFGQLSAGKHEFKIITEEQQTFTFSLPLRAGENAQALVTFHEDNRKPDLDIESSATVGGTLAVSAEAEEPAKGIGTISGQVISAETGKPVKDVQVYISGIKQKIRTDANGDFTTQVPAGTYSVSLLHAAFNTRNKDGIQVDADQLTALTFNLTPAGVDLPEHVVLEPYLAGSLTSVIEEQKDSAAVSDILGAEQISRAGDSEAAGALKRVSGVTVVGGKFVFIRGLGERYSSTLVNNAAIPSPDPTRRVVPLDLFPTSFLDSIVVQKSYSVDRPGEFAGGTINMRTRGIPDEFYVNISGEIGYIQGTTFEDGLRYVGGDTDFLGFDDGTRALPDSLAQATAGDTVLRPQTPFNPGGFTPAEIEQFGEDLSDIWDLFTETIPPDGKAELSMGDIFEVGEFDFGYNGAFRWDQDWDTRDEIRRTYAGSGSEELVLKEDYDVKTTSREVQLDGYLALEASFREDHQIFGKAILLRQTIDEARLQEGFTDAETNDVRRYQLEYIENQLYTFQAGGQHVFPFLHDLKFDWLWSRSKATRDAPKERRYRYDADDEGDYSFSRRADSNQTIYGELEDDDESWRVDVNLPLTFHRNFALEIQSGFIDQNRNRDSSIRRYDYSSVGPDSRNPDILALQSLEDILQPDYIGPNGFQLLEVTRSTDNYSATQKLLSYYGQLDMKFFDQLRITGGLRWEDNDQSVETVQLFNPSKEPIVTTLDRTDMLPAVATTWTINQQHQLRASYSQTLSRPDFRELSPAPFTDPVNDRETVGNPDLQQTEITSYDVRWEFYLSPNELFSAGFFWKDLINPIEKVFLPGPGGLLTFQNADTAQIYGFEVEMLKNLDFVAPFLEHFYIGSNITWSESLVELNAENTLAQTTSSRPLQGHSPYVINAQLGYENPNWGTTATLLYNTFGSRIVEVGLLGTPDKYQQPFNQFDFIYRQRLNDWLSLSIKMQNLLNDEVVVKQGDEITRSFRPGREFKLGLKINF